MGILINIADLAERIGAGTATFADKLAEETRGFACSLWENFPDQITKNNQLSSSFSRGFMNNLCKDKTLPSTPSMPFTGGQCPNLYKITWQEGWNISPGVYNWTQLAESQIGIGPYSKLVLRNNNTGEEYDKQTPDRARFNDLPWRARAYRTDGTFDEIPFPFGDKAMMRFISWSYIDSGAPTGGNSMVTGDDYFRRVDGGPDNCGDPPVAYPDTNPQPIDFNTTINIVSEDGDTLSYSLEYTPTNNISFPLNFNLGGIKVVFTLGGINFNFSLISIDGIPLPIPDGQDPPLPAPDDDANRNVRCKPVPTPNTDDYNEDTKTDTDPKEETVGEDLEFVRVTLTNVPTNVKNQFGDGAPDVIYAGWFEFQGEGYNFPRQPVHFNQNLYRKPEGATGYAYTLYQGISGFATVYTLKQEN